MQAVDRGGGGEGGGERASHAGRSAWRKDSKTQTQRRRDGRSRAGRGAAPSRTSKESLFRTFRRQSGRQDGDAEADFLSNNSFCSQSSLRHQPAASVGGQLDMAAELSDIRVNRPDPQ